MAARIPYTRALHEIRDGVFAYLQPAGGWGLSNAGLLVSEDSALLVDTLFDLAHTREMLAAMQRASAARIEAVVNTHANGDHCWGNALVRDARIIASQACAREMHELTPSKLHLLMRAARLVRRLGPLGRAGGVAAAALGLNRLRDFVDAAPYVLECFGRFEFAGIELAPPTETFRGRLGLRVGERRVELIEVGPAHTSGDVIVYVPDARVVFSGDIVFSGTHPLIWAGPVSGWIAACRTIAELDVDVVVPGHGPVGDLECVRQLERYFVSIEREARVRFEAKVPLAQAVREIAGMDLCELDEPERLVVSVGSVYNELAGLPRAHDAIAAFGAMARFARRR